MRYKTILVQLDIDVPAFPRLTFAWDLARHFDANLVGFCAAEPRMLIPGELDGTAAVDAAERQVAEIEDRLKTREAEFDSLAGDNGRASWRSEVGDPTRFLLYIPGRLTLLLLANPTSGPAETGQSILANSFFHRADRFCLLVAITAQ